MSNLDFSIQPWAIQTAYVILTISLLSCFWRILKGPSHFDRIVSSDLLAAIIMCFSGVLALETGIRFFLDLAMAIAVIAFIGAVALSRHLERAALQKTDDEEKAELEKGAPS
ncbi:MAG: monovalent cation/H+ antiporter complex subunit F [Verrucomicrobiota bacterium]